MRTETKYRKGLKELIEKRPLNEINVVILCDYVESNRQTFYYHYRDISDVIENIFLQERIASVRKLSNFDSVMHAVINYINNSYHFLSEVAKSFASEKLSEFLYSFYYKNLIIIYNKTERNYSTIIRYISTISAKELMFWISTKRKEKQTSLIRRLNVLWNYLYLKYEGDLKKN